MISVVIPTFNAKPGLMRLLDNLKACPFKYEVVVVDGGSTDGTADYATSRKCRVGATAKGRGIQLKAGAALAQGDWLLFLHADTVLDTGWAEALTDYFSRPDAADKAAYFTFALDDRVSQDARRVEDLTAWRCETFGLPYGDQGLLISRTLYQRVGGYEPVPLMEDVGLVRRIGKGWLVCLPAKAITSAARYKKDGYLLRPLRNLFCLALYYLGVSPRTIARIYG